MYDYVMHTVEIKMLKLLKTVKTVWKIFENVHDHVEMVQ